MSLSFCFFFVFVFFLSVITITQGSRWHTISSRKKWFEDFARSRGFDPLIADNWYKITPSQLAQQEVSSLLFFSLVLSFDLFFFSSPLFLLFVDYFNRAIVDCFGDIRPPQDHSAQSCNTFSRPSTRISISSTLGIVHTTPSRLFFFFLFSPIRSCLLAIVILLILLIVIDWNDRNNRRKALDKYAKTRGFDPLVYANWAKLLRGELMKDRVWSLLSPFLLLPSHPSYY